MILNRAVALAEIADARAALSALTPLESDKRMLSYQPYWAAKGHPLDRSGDTSAAIEALTIAFGLTTDDAVKGRSN